MEISVGHYYKPISMTQQVSAAIVSMSLAILTAMRMGVAVAIVVVVLVFGTMLGLGRGLSHLSYRRQRRRGTTADGVEFTAEAVESGRSGVLRIFEGRVVFQPRKGGEAVDLAATEIGHVYLTPINRFVVATHVSLITAGNSPVEMNVTAPGSAVERAFRRCIALP
jgi:hypothetical protein